MQTKAEIIGMAKRTQIKVDPENEQNTGIVGVKLLKGLFETMVYVKKFVLTVSLVFYS